MSPMRAAAIKLIQEIPEDKLFYVLNLIKGMNELHEGLTDTLDAKQSAYQHLQTMRGSVPANLDYDSELVKSRTERYASVN